MTEGALKDTSANAIRWITGSKGAVADVTAITVSHWFRPGPVKPPLPKTIKLSTDAVSTAISAGRISMRRIMRWCCALTRIRRSKSSTGPSRNRLRSSATSRAAHRATFATARRRCSGSGHLQRQGDCLVQGVTPARGVRTVHVLERQGGPCGSGRRSGARQPLDAQTLHGEAMAARAAALVICPARSWTRRSKTKQGPHLSRMPEAGHRRAAMH